MVNIDWGELDKRIVAEYELMLDREIVNLILQGVKCEKITQSFEKRVKNRLFPSKNVKG